MAPQLEQDLEELALASRILALGGHEDATLGHVGLRDPDGRGVWLKRRGIGLSEVQGPADFVLVDFDGVQLEGEGGRHSEWPLHTEIMLKRPEIRVSAHSHPRYATLVSALDTEFKLVTQDGIRVRNQKVARFDGTPDLVTTREEGAGVAAALGDDAWVVLLVNHGVSFFAGGPRELALAGLNLEGAARTLIELLSTGAPIIVPDPSTVQIVAGTLDNAAFVADNWAFRVRELKRHEDRTR